jgi:hypothetical protein
MNENWRHLFDGSWRQLLFAGAGACLAFGFGVSSLVVSLYLILVHRLARELEGRPRPPMRVPLTVFVFLTSPIWAAAMLHYLEGTAVLLTEDADGSLGVAALLSFFHSRYLAAAAMFGASAAALWALFDERCTPRARLLALAAQQVLLLVTSLSAISQVAAHEYADHVPRAAIFILCDQYQRIMAALFHSLAIAGRMRLRIR